MDCAGGVSDSGAVACVNLCRDAYAFGTSIWTAHHRPDVEEIVKTLQ